MKGKTISGIMLLLLFVGVLTLPLQIEGELYDGLIPASSGNSVTVYERTSGWRIHTFSVAILMGAGGTFITNAREYYNVTSDGTYLKIHCFRDDWRSGHGVGNNIAAVKLNGVPSFPEGLWASIIVNYTLGYNGIAESRFNALGPDTQIGPYGSSLCTYMGDQHSDLVLGFARPHITVLSPQNKSYATTSIPLTFIVNETASWMGYSLDGQANITVTGNTTLTSLCEGSHQVVIYANSTTGTMWASSTVYFTVDTTPPPPPPPSTPTYFMLTQGNRSWFVVPVQNAESATEFYDYYSVSGHTPFMESHVGKLYLYHDTQSNALSLILHQGIDDDTPGTMESMFDFEDVPEGAFVSVSDEPQGIGSSPRSPGLAEFDLALEPEAHWANTYNSDGGVLSRLRMDEPWNMTIIPTFIRGVQAWRYVQGNGTEIALTMEEPITIGLRPRAITILSPQQKAYATTSIPLTFIVNETASWIGYSLDGQANVTVAGNTTLTGLLEGSHSVVVYANNTAGTMEASGTVYFTVDLTLPTVSVLSPESKTYVASSIPLTFTVSEPTMWMGYSLDDQANVTISGNTALPGLAEGAHSVVVYVKDAAGNTGSSNEVFFTVELVGGLCAISVEPSKTIVAQGQIVTATVAITNITDCAGYQLWIDYDSTVLELISWTFGTDPSNPLSPTQMAPSAVHRVDTNASVPGSVKLATVWKAGVPSYSGSGVAAEITFQALTTGNSTLVFDQYWTKAVNSLGEEILFGRFDNPAWVFVTLPGDVDGDRDVDVGDQRKVQLAMFSVPGTPNWDPNMDIDNDLDVDVGDQRKQQLNMFDSW